MKGMVPVLNPPASWIRPSVNVHTGEVMGQPEGCIWIDGVLWVPYKAMFPVGSTVGWASGNRCRCDACESGTAKNGIYGSLPYPD